MELQIPNSTVVLVPGCIVKLHRFDFDEWVVGFGWYSWGHNRPVCGWYLTNKESPKVVKPLQLPDLDDIYMVTNEPTRIE